MNPIDHRVLSGNSILAAPETSSVGIILPTLNAAGLWPKFRDALLASKVDASQVVIVDSASTDSTAALARASGFRVISIPRSEFDHGGTRQWATRFLPDAEILIFFTQDAILATPDAIEELVTAFRDPQVGAAYGRQLPRREAGPIEAHARLFNYPAVAEVRSLECRERLGFKATFISNSFAAYRRKALDEAGGFPRNTIVSEDTVTAARLLLRGWKVAYVASACVYHSHNYSPWQEFKRYFDIGVLHSREPWLAQEFGGANSEGKRFVKSEIKHLWSSHALLIPWALVRTTAKLMGYRLGKREAGLNVGVKLCVSQQRAFWSREWRSTSSLFGKHNGAS